MPIIQNLYRESFIVAMDDVILFVTYHLSKFSQFIVKLLGFDLILCDFVNGFLRVMVCEICHKRIFGQYFACGTDSINTLIKTFLALNLKSKFKINRKEHTKISPMNRVF